jgi:hypothetical protein
MLMSCCCKKTYKFCYPINPCDKNSFANLFKGLLDGNYIVQLNYLDAILNIAITIVGSVVDATNLNLSSLNESYTYTGKVINNIGEVVPLTKDNVVYDCFQFATNISVPVNNLV